MIEYTTTPLAEAKEHFPRMHELIAAVNERTGSTYYTEPGYLERSARRGDLVVLAWDGDILAGFMLLGRVEFFLDHESPLEFRIWLAQNGYDFRRLGVDHAAFLDPAYWQAGLTSDLFLASVGNDRFDFSIFFRAATSKLSQWVEAQPWSIPTGHLDAKGEPIFLRDLR